MKFSGRIYMKWVAIWVVACLMNISGAFAQEEVALSSALEQAPSTAPVVWVVPNMDRLSQKIASLNEMLGLSVPQMSDMLGEFRRMIEVEQGLREDGPLLVVLPELNDIEDEDPPVVLVLPVTSAQNFFANYQTEEADGIFQLTMKATGQTAFGKSLGGNFVAISETRDAVVAYTPGRDAQTWLKNIGKATESYAENSDLLMIINMPVIAPQLLPKFDEASQKSKDEIAASIERGEINQGQALVVQMMTQTGIDFARAIVRDSTAAVWGVDLTETGIGMTGGLQFAQGSPTAKLIGETGGAEAHLARLPSQPYLFASSYSLNGLDINPMLDRILEVLPPAEEGKSNVGDLVRQAMPLVRNMTGTASAYYQPQQAGMMNSMLNGVTVIQTQDGPAYVQALRQYIEGLAKVSIPMSPDAMANPNAPGGNLTFTAQYNVGVLKLENDISVDQYQVQYNLPPALLNEMGQMGGLMMMVGMGQSGYVTNVGNYVVSTTTTDAAMLKQAISTIESAQGLGAVGSVAAARATALPQNPAFEAYISVSGIANTANLFMGMMGGQQEPMIQVPANLPPIAMGLSTREHGVVGRFHIPGAVLQFFKNVNQQMQGGGDEAMPMQ